MKTFVDAYGEQLWSYFKTGEPRNEIIERIGSWFDYLLVSKDELRKILRTLGGK